MSLISVHSKAAADTTCACRKSSVAVPRQVQGMESCATQSSLHLTRKPSEDASKLGGVTPKAPTQHWT